MKIKTILTAAVLTVLLTVPVLAQDLPGLKVVPWNGHKAATSLTFDDGDPSHLDVVVPELNKRHLHGTFFLIANKISREDDWRKILLDGHEIGNHTLDHKHASELTPADEEAQVVGAQNVLQKEFGIAIYTFAYPFIEISPGLKAQVAKTDLLARGGYGIYDITPDQDLDWMNIPSQTTMTAYPFSTYQGWIDDDFQKGGWLVWMIHGLEGTPWGWQPITKNMFGQILDDIQSKDMWVDTFVQIGSYLRAEKTFEKSVPQKSGSQETWTWDIPDHFPPGVILKLQVASGAATAGANVEIRQGDQKLSPDAKGFYPVNFDLKKLTLTLLPKN
ncbi:MAG TPA: polysaccharide deacetylase family protein [bacterium]|nr:polysaccharide deacetylase family protein [bacterium]